jgi:Rrf2 family protein
MRISARVDYAIRAMVVLAAAEPRAITANDLAAAQEIPDRFLDNILVQLRARGLVQSQRGPEGGYRLARPAREIALAEIIRALEGPLANVRGRRAEELSYPGPAAPLREVWIALRANVRQVLEQVTLADIAAAELPPVVRQLTADPAAWSPR